MKHLLLFIAIAFSIGSLKAQLYYDPTMMTPGETQMFNNMFQGLMKSYDQHQQNMNKASKASVNFMLMDSEITAYLTYTGASAAKIVYQNPGGAKTTLERDVDFFVSNGFIVVTYSLKPGSTLYVYNSGTSKLLAKGKIPARNTPQFKLFKTAAMNNALKFQQLYY